MFHGPGDRRTTADPKRAGRCYDQRQESADGPGKYPEHRVTYDWLPLIENAFGLSALPTAARKRLASGLDGRDKHGHGDGRLYDNRRLATGFSEPDSHVPWARCSPTAGYLFVCGVLLPAPSAPA
jgi:hypothetical protein